MMYSFAPRSKVITAIPGVPFGRVPPNYLRDNMIATLAQQEWSSISSSRSRPTRTGCRSRMPGTLAREALALRPGGEHPHPAPEFDTPAHDALAKRLSINPWHCLRHRPLGNQSRARRRMYLELSRLRQEINGTPHIEPTGAELPE